MQAMDKTQIINHLTKYSGVQKARRKVPGFGVFRYQVYVKHDEKSDT